MQFQLSDHAAKRLIKRGIRPEWVEAAINEPDTTRPDENDAELVHAIKMIPEKGFKTLRVVYNETTEPYRVVTAFFE